MLPFAYIPSTSTPAGLVPLNLTTALSVLLFNIEMVAYLIAYPAIKLSKPLSTFLILEFLITIFDTVALTLLLVGLISGCSDE